MSFQTKYCEECNTKTKNVLEVSKLKTRQNIRPIANRDGSKATTSKGKANSLNELLCNVCIYDIGIG